MIVLLTKMDGLIIQVKLLYPNLSQAFDFERCHDLGGETFQKAFVNRAGSVYSERDAPRSSGSRGVIEWRIDALVP